MGGDMVFPISLILTRRPVPNHSILSRHSLHHGANDLRAPSDQHRFHLASAFGRCFPRMMGWHGQHNSSKLASSSHDVQLAPEIGALCPGDCINNRSYSRPLHYTIRVIPDPSVTQSELFPTPLLHNRSYPRPLHYIIVGFPSASSWQPQWLTHENYEVSQNQFPFPRMLHALGFHKQLSSQELPECNIIDVSIQSQTSWGVQSSSHKENRKGTLSSMSEYEHKLHFWLRQRSCRSSMLLQPNLHPVQPNPQNIIESCMCISEAYEFHRRIFRLYGSGNALRMPCQYEFISHSLQMFDAQLCMFTSHCQAKKLSHVWFMFVDQQFSENPGVRQCRVDVCLQAEPVWVCCSAILPLHAH